ncbi:MAG: penicillin-binding protein 2 [Proteobacteria bacterium]|nr:penicillin-binding protein 2 [Pseudomonadota bacterium]
MRREVRRSGVFTRRALAVLGGQAAVLGLLGARLYQVQVTDGARYATLARQNRVSLRMIAPVRGTIVDRFATVVAGNKQNWRALLIAEQAPDVARTLDRFSAIVPLDARARARIGRDIRRNRRFIPVLVQDFLTWAQMAEIEENAPDLPGILVDVGETRVYPFGPTLAHLVGYVAPPTPADVAADPTLALPGMRVGRTGVEKFRERDLRGIAGAVQMEVNAYGRVIRELARQEGTPGAEVTLTIDTALQQVAMDRLGGESAAAVLLDCRNGEVLAMASAPSFDPSLFDTGVSAAQWHDWVSNERAPLIDKATVGVYSPGSTFKMAVGLAALSAGAVTPTTTFFCPGYFQIGNRKFYCWKRGGHGTINMHTAIEQSCDVFFYHTALAAGIDRIAAMAHRFGLGTKLDLDLPMQAEGLIPTRAWRRAQGHPWELGETAISGIGQGFVQVTPLQLATYAARLATGRAVQPHVTRAIGGVALPGGQATDWPLLDLPEPLLDLVRGGMFAVVNRPQGTGWTVRLPPALGVHMAGKTGSAQVTDVSQAERARGGYHSSKMAWKLRPNALFVAYAPFDAPRYAAAVVVAHGDEGASAAAPIVRDLMVAALTRDPAGRAVAPGGAAGGGGSGPDTHPGASPGPGPLAAAGGTT